MVPGWHEYEVSSFGKIRRITSKNGWLGERKPYLDSSGRPTIRLTCGERSKAMSVSRIVGLAFLDPPLPGQTEVAHRDGNNVNNWKGNLRWSTRAENEHDKILHATSNRGERHGRSKLDEKTVMKIAADLRAGKRQRFVAGKYKVSRSAVLAINVGRSWSWLTGIPRHSSLVNLGKVS